MTQQPYIEIYDRCQANMLWKDTLELILISSHHSFTEGPTYLDTSGAFIFSDIPKGQTLLISNIVKLIQNNPRKYSLPAYESTDKKNLPIDVICTLNDPIAQPEIIKTGLCKANGMFRSPSLSNKDADWVWVCEQGKHMDQIINKRYTFLN